MRARHVLALCFSVAACSSLIGIEDPEVAPADGPVCKASPCDLAPQCGCSGAACDINTNGGHVCRPTGTGTEMSTCTTLTDCERGYTCAIRYGAGHCVKWCSSDSECGTRGACVDQIETFTTAITCSSDCDPLAASNPCPTGWSCDYLAESLGGTTHDVLECRASGSVGTGGSCASSPAVCKSGLTCVNFSSGSLCEPMCSPSSNTSCPSGSCRSFSTKFIVAGIEYGACW